jgi:signal transduction histidine kinase
MPEDNLEQILEAFDQIKGTFHSPRTLSYEHDDVTIKYWNSMLKMAEEKGTARESIVDSFCARFDADQEQMEDLLSNKHNWVDYNLYHAFSAHCQQQLGMDTEEFWQGVADKTFQDHSDKQIAVGRFFPLDFVIKQMSKQFKNWSKVNDIQVEKLDRSRNSYKIKRKTFPETQKRTEQLIGKEALDVLLKRDCFYTHCSFTTTFQKLFNQPRLYLETGQSEADGNEWSEYFVHPSSPHRFKAVEKYYSFIASLKNFGRSHKGNLKKENEEFRQIIFEYEQTISARTRDLELANAKIERDKYQLQSRQDLIVSLLGSISKLRLSSDRHAIRNYLGTASESEKNVAVEQMARQIGLAYTLVKNNPEGLTYLQKATQPFGITPENLSNQKGIEDILHQIDFKKRDSSEETVDQDRAAFWGKKKKITFSLAYEEFISVRDSHKDNPETKQINEIDFFQQFYSLITIREVIDYVNKRLAAVGDINFDQLTLSEALPDAIKNAEIEKGVKLETITQLDYDPTFITDRTTIVQALTDLCYNSIEHSQATTITLAAYRPTKEKAGTLPYQDQFHFGGGYPQAYICFTDNGQSISEEKAEQLNKFLSGELQINSTELSSREKEEGGRGTSNLSHFLGLHKGHCFYEAGENTKIHIYLERLDI